MNKQEAGETLQYQAIESLAELEDSIAGRAGSVSESTRKILIIGDAFTHLEDTVRQEPWPAAVASFVTTGIRLGKLSRSMLKYSLLQPRKKNARDILIDEARQELFINNPSYHGRRHGEEYAKAVASQRLKV